MNKRTPRRMPTANVPQRRPTFPAYPVSRRVPADESPALSPDQIPVGDEADADLPNAVEAAEALGRDERDLHADIRDEEQQRHPDAHDEDDSAASREAVADEFHYRLSGGRRR